MLFKRIQKNIYKKRYKDHSKFVNIQKVLDGFEPGMTGLIGPIAIYSARVGGHALFLFAQA